MNLEVGAKAPPLPHATVDKEPGDINPDFVGEFLGCDVVMDDQVFQNVENNDDLEDFDSIGVTLPVPEQVAPAAPAEYTAHTVDTDAPAAPVSQSCKQSNLNRGSLVPQLCILVPWS